MAIAVLTVVCIHSCKYIFKQVPRDRCTFLEFSLSSKLRILYLDMSSATTLRSSGVMSSSMDEPAVKDDADEAKHQRQSLRKTKSKPSDPYSFDGVTGWKGYRILRPFRGMYHDVRRRLPYYPSDISDAWTYRTVASIVRMYFVK